MRRNIIRNIINQFSVFLPDEIYLKLQYKRYLGKKLNLKNPNTFSEKIQWLKLYDRKEDYVNYVDKYLVRDYIKRTVGEDYLIPLISKYESVEDIDWNELPNQFVLKCTHGSHCHIICTDKSKLNKTSAKKNLNKWMKRNWYWYGREWPYKNLKPKIICEEFLKDEKQNNDGLIDYKFFCFNGRPLFCQVIRNRNSEQTIDFFDINWNHMEFTGLQKDSRRSDSNICKPEKFNEMLKIAEELSKGHIFIRVDLYSVNEKIYFGELTFYPLSGFGEFQPSEWNEKLGKLIKLPIENNN